MYKLEIQVGKLKQWTAECTEWANGESKAKVKRKEEEEITRLVQIFVIDQRRICTRKDRGRRNAGKRRRVEQ